MATLFLKAYWPPRGSTTPCGMAWLGGRMSCHDDGSTEFCQKPAGGAVLTFQRPFKETTGCLTALVTAGSGTTTGLGHTGFSGIADTSTAAGSRSEEHTSELQSLRHLVCRLLLE